ncbi:MAG: hypothetical protein GX208_04340 [Firmicutes bacterium]|nr:hypothetical protein [Bacillota bacterium]
MVFFSPSRGAMDIDEVFADLLEYASKHPEDQYSLIIGTDSQIKESKKEICYVTALIVHRKGKGARFYYTREYDQIIRSLRQRIFYETSRSLVLASQIMEKLTDSAQDFDVEIHLDVGNNGATKTLIKEVVGMVVGSGFNARIKPDSYGASSVADKYTK